VGGLDDTSIW
jgi:hypothetical protein